MLPSLNVDSSPLDRQFAFIVEIDRLKTILRQNYLADHSRRENSAEHSWHVALMALVLAEHAESPVNISRVIELLLVHDLVEIDAGDTFAYDTALPAADALVFTLKHGGLRSDGGLLGKRSQPWMLALTAQARRVSAVGARALACS